MDTPTAGAEDARVKRRMTNAPDQQATNAGRIPLGHTFREARQ